VHCSDALAAGQTEGRAASKHGGLIKELRDRRILANRRRSAPVLECEPMLRSKSAPLEVLISRKEGGLSQAQPLHFECRRQPLHFGAGVEELLSQALLALTCSGGAAG